MLFKWYVAQKDPEINHPVLSVSFKQQNTSEQNPHSRCHRDNLQVGTANTKRKAPL